MANGLLGKKVVSSRDVELVYTVPSARTATFNINVLNNSAAAANVEVYVSDKTYQTKDFEDYNAEDAAFSSATISPLEIVGASLQSAAVLSGNVPAQLTSTSTASPQRAQLKFETNQTNGVVAATSITAGGKPLTFYHGTNIYARHMGTGDVKTIANYLSGSSATTSSAQWGQAAATDNVHFATNVDAAHAVFYYQGASAGAITVNSITDYRNPSAATYGTAFSWNAGQITKMIGVKTTEERFITGTATGIMYVSTSGIPTTNTMLSTGGTLFAPAAAAGNLVGGCAIGDATAGKLYLALTSDKVIYAAYSTGTAIPTTTANYSYFDFPAGVTNADLIDVRAEGSAFVLVTAAGVTHKTVNDGLTWTTGKHYPVLPFDISVSASKFAVDGVTSAEITLVRGRTYRFHTSAATNNTHPFGFSTTADGSHSNGAAYDTGVAYKVGNPTATADFAATYTTHADFVTNHATYNGQPRLVEITVAAGAPNTLYAYCPTHAGMGFSIQIVDEPTTAPHDANTVFIPSTIWNADNGDAIKKWDVFIDGATFSREERFYSIPQVDLFDVANIAVGEILERTGIMASAGEQVIVKTDGEGMIVRVHGIEE